MAILRAKTESGWVEGMPAGNQKFTVFRGVPFAAPPVGELRWRAPQPMPAWEGVRQCFRFAPIAMQEPFPSEGGGIAADDFYVGDLRCSEDCLYLNIWTPAKSAGEKLPVAVYIHGGGHQTGYSYLNCYDGEGFCRRGIVMVTIPYRLNVFGYLAHPELSAEGGGTSGNYGVRDQAAALAWVQRNIAAFGASRFPAGSEKFDRRSGNPCGLTREEWEHSVIAERSVMAQMEHASERYNIDFDRLFAMGNSGGSLGIFRQVQAIGRPFFRAAACSGGVASPWCLDYPALIQAKTSFLLVMASEDVFDNQFTGRTAMPYFKEQGMDVSLHVVGGGRHLTGWVHALAEIFDFFDRFS